LAQSADVLVNRLYDLALVTQKHESVATSGEVRSMAAAAEKAPG
jgi:hypothetical protein